MEKNSSRDIELAIPYLEEGQIVSTSRYNWKCWDRGEAPYVILQWTQSGEGVFENTAEKLRVPANHAFIATVPERSSYYYPPDGEEPWVFHWLNFYGSLACEIFSRFQAEFGPVIPIDPHGAAAATLRRLIGRKRESDPPDRFKISAQIYDFALEWWREASKPSGNPENRLARAIRFSQDHFREPLSVKQLADEAGMSREHFSRVFLESTGESPSACLRRLRMNEATLLLRSTDLPLREIAMRSGFYSERHFMRTFQRSYDANPSEYRRNKESLSRKQNQGSKKRPSRNR